MIFDVKVEVDGRTVENGWTDQPCSLDALDLAVSRARDHVNILGLRSPRKVEIVVEER